MVVDRIIDCLEGFIIRHGPSGVKKGSGIGGRDISAFTYAGPACSGDPSVLAPPYRPEDADESPLPKRGRGVEIIK